MVKLKKISPQWSMGGQGLGFIPLYSQPLQRAPHIVLPSHSSPAPASSPSNSCFIQLFWKSIPFHRPSERVHTSATVLS